MRLQGPFVDLSPFVRTPAAPTPTDCSPHTGEPPPTDTPPPFNGRRKPKRLLSVSLLGITLDRAFTLRKSAPRKRHRGRSRSLLPTGAADEFCAALGRVEAAGRFPPASYSSLIHASGGGCCMPPSIVNRSAPVPFVKSFFFAARNRSSFPSVRNGMLREGDKKCDSARLFRAAPSRCPVPLFATDRDQTLPRNETSCPCRPTTEPRC